jgi:hypothetical protein
VTFRRLRIAVLLVILAVVAADTWLQRARIGGWDEPLWVAIYPINADRSEDVARFIAQLDASDFDPIEGYLEAQARRYGEDIDGLLRFQLAPPLEAMPPPAPYDGHWLQIAWWSLRMRFWAWRHDSFDGLAQIRMFVAYHSPRRHERLAHSLGLQKGHLSVVNAFGSERYRGRNRVVIAHELLHTLGASDKYDPRTGEPVYPAGYAEPGLEPLVPQRLAELMGGRIVLGPTRLRMPESLAQTLIGEATARELGWR